MMKSYCVVMVGKTVMLAHLLVDGVRFSDRTVHLKCPEEQVCVL